jgi:hypothetical protein
MLNGCGTAGATPKNLRRYPLRDGLDFIIVATEEKKKSPPFAKCKTAKGKLSEIIPLSR